MFSSIQDSLVVIFPGAGGPDINTQHLQEAIQRSDRGRGVNRYVEVYDWLNWRGNFLRASFDGQAVGKAVCSTLAKEESEKGVIKNLQVVGVSVGAFAADSCVKTFNAKHQGIEKNLQANIRLTLLDPFTSKGIFGYAWGANNFGKGVDVVECYLNRDDPVPTTNDPLPAAYTIDVTNSKLREAYKLTEGESMHSWPVAYLAETWRTEVDNKGNIVDPTPTQEPKGAVVIAP